MNAHLPLIAILRGIRPVEVEEHVLALIAAGITRIEIPTNSPEWETSVATAVAVAGSKAQIGAGTVLSRGDIDALWTAGGRLVVTPNVDPEVIVHAVANGMQCVTGFLTPTEAFAALKAGAQSLKLFPASQLGPGYISALRAVLPLGTPLYAVGGITPENLPDFIRAGCDGAGLGGDLYRPGQTASDTSIRTAAFVRSLQGAKQCPQSAGAAS